MDTWNQKPSVYSIGRRFLTLSHSPIHYITHSLTDSLYSLYRKLPGELSGHKVCNRCIASVFIKATQWKENDQNPTTFTMSFDLLSNGELLCSEDSTGILSAESPECSSDIDSFFSTEESIARFLKREQKFVPGFDYLSRFESQSLDATAREESVAWILKVQAYHGFHPLTAYLSVNYMDRFLYCRRLPKTNGWPMQLLAVACLSLAAKMEEPLLPSLLDLQMDGAKHIFEARTISRMEMLVLGALDWSLRSVTPFSFLDFFACKLDSAGTFVGFLISRATEIIFSNIKETSFLAYWPSCIAAAAILSAANEIPNLSLVNPEHAESWCDGLRKEKIRSCYQLMQDLVMENKRRKHTNKVRPDMRSGVSLVSSSSSSSSTTSSSSYKRRKLNNCSWVDDDKENSE